MHPPFPGRDTFTHPPRGRIITPGYMDGVGPSMESTHFTSRSNCPDCGAPLRPVEGCALCLTCGHSTCD
jgi:hypothetical protein